MTPAAALRRAAFALTALVMLAGAAADPAERLRDPAQEARARALFRDVRCLVCQSQSIDESDAELAHDLRQVVRQQIAAGKTDDQIRAFLLSRYGQFVLLTPRFSPGNAVLWVGPLLVVILGGAALVGRRKRSPSDADALTAQEEKALAKLSRDETL
jgi:cytochrome c-type biogenesis protein CcmH